MPLRRRRQVARGQSPSREAVTRGGANTPSGASAEGAGNGELGTESWERGAGGTNDTFVCVMADGNGDLYRLVLDVKNKIRVKSFYKQKFIIKKDNYDKK